MAGGGGLSDAALALQAKGIKAASGAPISRLTSFKLGGPAALLVEPSDEDQLAETGTVLVGNGLETLVIGRGTNVLVSDHGFDGAVIRLGKPFEWIRGDGPVVEAGGAAPLPQVANWAARRGLSGLEFSIAIPATVGGSVRMNAGAHGSSVSDVLSYAVVCKLGEPRLQRSGPADLEMSYRHTGLGPRDVVCSAGFVLVPADRAEITSRMDQFRSHRAATQPAEPRNAGSMFRNPEGMSAGALIEGSGLKGFRIGGAHVSDKHANFFIADPGARAQDVYDLMVTVQNRVLEDHEVLLVPEVRVLGAFEHAVGTLRHP